MSEWWTVFVSVLAAIFTAFLTARSAVQSARQQSLDTERLKLVRGAAERHLSKFHELTDRLAAISIEAPHDARWASELLNGHPQVIISLCSASRRVTATSRHRDAVFGVERIVQKCYYDLIRVVQRRQDESGALDELTEKASDCAARLEVGLTSLRIAVDLAAEARLYEDVPDYQTELAELSTRCLGILKKDLNGPAAPEVGCEHQSEQ